MGRADPAAGASVPFALRLGCPEWGDSTKSNVRPSSVFKYLGDLHRVTGNVLDALNQPLVFFLLLVGTGCFLIAGELQTMVRESRRTARQGGATRKVGVCSIALNETPLQLGCRVVSAHRRMASARSR